MRYRPIIVAGYFAACLLWIHGPASDQTDAIWWVVALGLLQPAFGALLGRWWAAPLPIALVPMSVPAGYGSGELPLWFGMMFLAGFAVPLVLFGVIARKVGTYHVRRTGSRSTVAIAGVCIAIGLVALGLFLGLSSARSSGFKGNSSVSEAERFQGFPVFYAGRDMNGHELAMVRREPLGSMRKDQESFAFTYGTCEGGNDACSFPVEISNEPACSRNLAMYGPLSPVPHRTRVRGAPAAFFEGGSRLEIQTGTTTVVIFARSKRDALSVARSLRGVNIPIGPNEQLPPAAPGALKGKVACPR